MRTRRGPRLLAILACLIGLLIIASLTGLGWLLMGYPGRRGPGRGRLIAVELQAGESLERVAAQLAAAGVLSDPVWFALHARLRGAAERLRNGEILVYDSMSPKQLLQRIASGYGSAELRVVVPEGFSRFEIGERLARWRVCSREAFLSATEDKTLLWELQISSPSAEGLLFPDTYLLREEMDPRTLVRRFVRNARRRMAELSQQERGSIERLRAQLGWGEAQVLTLASIVEKEAAMPAEQPMVAGVFLNRLRDPAWKPKRLQADPTVAYGCLVAPHLTSCAGFDGRQITRAMLLDGENPYNTYRRDGLPPGPIANPGLSALRSVLAPATHDYFYFVAKGGGSHAFSRDLQAHNAAVELFRGR